MITVRSIIVEALNRSNLVSRRQSAPADMVESAYRLLKGIAGKYSNDNLLQFLVMETETTLDKSEYVLGDVDPANPEEYQEVTLAAPNIQQINKVYWRAKQPNDAVNYIELSFASPSDFDAFPSGSGVYTWQPINDRQIVLKLKLLPDVRTEIKVSYNRKWVFDLDTELRIPEQYEELFIVALTHKLAVTFPRISTEQVQLIKTELDDIKNNIMKSTRAIKYLQRKPNTVGVNRAAFYSGTMFLNP